MFSEVVVRLLQRYSKRGAMCLREKVLKTLIAGEYLLFIVASFIPTQIPSTTFTMMYMWADAISLNLVLQATITFTSGYKKIYILSLHPTFMSSTNWSRLRL